MELVGEILCRSPLTCTRAVRCTCKKWNSLFKDGSFTKKHLAQAAAAEVGEREGEFLAISMINYGLYLTNVNLHKSRDPCVKQTSKVISLDGSGSDQVEIEISRVCHCQGLLLCTTKDYTRLVVWNPYTGQPRWIPVEPRSAQHRLVWYGHTLGYDKSRNHKILRFAQPSREEPLHEIYDLNTNSWRVLDVTPDWNISYNNYGLSLKGDTYWFAHDKESRGRGDVPDFLLCFDFTTESFGPRLSLPFESYYEDAVILSSVREEQLAVLFQRWDTFEMEVWVTTKIEHNAFSWSKFLAVDMGPVSGFQFYLGGSFLIDDKSKAVVVVDEDKDRASPTRDTAYIIGVNGYYKEVDLGEIATYAEDRFPLVCSYVLSSVQFKQPA